MVKLENKTQQGIFLLSQLFSDQNGLFFLPTVHY